MKFKSIKSYLKSDPQHRGIPDHIVEIFSGDEIVFAIPDGDFNVRIIDSFEELFNIYSLTLEDLKWE